MGGTAFMNLVMGSTRMTGALRGPLVEASVITARARPLVEVPSRPVGTAGPPVPAAMTRERAGQAPAAQSG